MRKKIIWVVIILIVAVLLIPIPQKLKDGGSVRYSALFYSITDVHRLNPDLESDRPYLEGIEIEILGVEIYSNIE